MADIAQLMKALELEKAKTATAEARVGAAEARLAMAEQERGRPVEKSVEKPGKKFFCPTALAGQTCTNKKCRTGKLLHPEDPDWTQEGAEEAKSKILLARGRERSQSPSGKRRSSRSQSPRARARAKVAKQRAFEAGLRAGAAAAAAK